MRPERLTRALAVAVGLTLLVALATLLVRLGRPTAGDVAAAFDTVEGLELAAEHGGRPGDPCRMSALLAAERPREARVREYAVVDGVTGVVAVAVHDFGDSGRAGGALEAAVGGLSRCRGFRAVAPNGNAFRFEYTAVGPSDVGSEGYAVAVAGRSESDVRLRTEQRGHLFRRGRLVVVVAWQSTLRVDETQVRCLAELADAAARGDRLRRCTTAGSVAT